LPTFSPAPVVALEDLYGGWDGLTDGIERLRSQVLVPIAEGRAAAVPEYDWWRTSWRPARPLAPPDALVVEGVGSAAGPLREHLALVVWVDVPAHLRRARALHRDDGLFTPFWDGWAAQETALLRRDRTPEFADVVVDGTATLPASAVSASATAIEPGAAVRHTARVLLLDPEDRVLLLQQREPASGALAWSAPGGGVEPGEPAAEAAVRETWEETGLRDVALGPEVWRRGAIVRWDGALFDSRERWWLARVPAVAPAPGALTAAEQRDILAWRWWRVGELLTQRPATVPWDLASRVAALIEDGLPPRPLYLPT
jgi:8-oxo-dGTP pyrophosphatase MutT (NUDIX family)